MLRRRREERQQQQQSLDWPPQFSFTGDRLGIFPCSRRMAAAAVVGAGGLPPAERPPVTTVGGSTGKMEAGAAVVGRLRADDVALSEVSYFFCRVS